MQKIQGNLSAGRVQSVTLRLVVDREREIENFKPEEYWTLIATLEKQGEKDKVKAFLVDGKDKKIKTKEQMDAILNDVTGADFNAVNVKKSVTASHPSAPFNTSSMQQDALNKLGMSLKQTTQTAQGLYEGVDIVGEGKVALVTYIRTDSVRVSPEAQKMAKDYITENLATNICHQPPAFIKTKKTRKTPTRPSVLSRLPARLKA